MFWLVLISYIGVGLLLVAIAQPLIERKVKPNPWYGVRTPKTLSDEDIWYKANEYGGRVLRIMGMITAAAAVGLSPVALLGVQAYALLCAGVLFGSTIWMAIVTLKYIAKL